MKNKLFVFIGILVFIVICALSYYYVFEKSYSYYTRIDNTKVEELNSGDMRYKYKLVMYDEGGRPCSIAFKTSRKLREGAFIKVKYYLISGVNKWEEVEYKSLPLKAQEKYN